MPRSLRLFARYLREVYRHGEILLGSLLLSIATAALDYWTAASMPPWSYAVLIGIGTVYAQFKAWCSLLAQTEMSEPELGEGLALVEEKSVAADSRNPPALDAALRLEVAPAELLDLHIVTTAPILEGDCSLITPPYFTERIQVRRQTFGVCPLGDQVLPIGCVFFLRIYSHQPVALRRLTLVPRKKD